VDLSAVIFVVLALAWAVYLIPKALNHHDEVASDRLVEGHSDKVRILSRKTRSTTVTETAEVVEEPATEASVPARPAALPTRAAARKAAQRRRRVLGVLVVVFAVVYGFTWFAYLPYMTPVIPGALVVGWLVLARLSVRKQQARRTGPVVEPVETTPSSVVERGTVVEPVDTTPAVERLTDEDTTGLQRQELEQALADDGSLWDPLPVTLPTYVNKARARRTVRTIELTGINSSGHDQADTALAREAEESAESAQAQPVAGERKVAGA
jgi:hypothetical protein